MNLLLLLLPAASASATFTTGTLKTIIPWSYRPESVTAVTDGYLVGSMSPECDDGKPIDPHSQCGGVHKVKLDGQLDTSFANITGLSMVRGVYAPNSETLLVASQTDGGTVSRYILNATGATLVKHISVGSLPPSGTAPAPNCICMNDDNTKAYVTIPGWNAKTWLPSGTGSGLLEIDMATDTASMLFWNESSVFPNGCDVEDDMVYLGNFNYPLATYNITTRMVDTSIAWASGLGFPAGQGMTDNVIADGIVAYNGDLFVGMAKLAFPDDSAPTGTGNLWRCEGVLTGTVDSVACKEIAILPVADMQLDENGPALIIPSLFGHEVKSMCIDTGCSGASASADTTTTASASSGDCASITDTVCAMEGVTVFCELLKDPKRRHLDLTASADENTDAGADAATVMSSPTGASASSADGTEDFASAFGFEDESEEFTLFVPTDAAFEMIDDAFETLSDAEAGRVLMFHMYSGMLLTSDKLACSETITSMNEMGDASRTKCKNDGKKYQNGNGNTKTGSMPEIDTADHMACNGVIHTLDHVMFPVSLSQLHADAAASASASSNPTTTGEYASASASVNF
mmetsp:Transcript_26108/g.28102  ORF Transcript_26108/g.28102 Transcript_26108/m.28102 type:complete len:575 (-) Transcript_26108:268-1992(-)